MWVVEDVPELIYGFAISPRLVGNHALNRSQRKREKCVAAAVQRRSYRLKNALIPSEPSRIENACIVASTGCVLRHAPPAHKERLN
jgi:hypothetical protein